MATLASPSLAGSSHTSLSMLPNSTLALAQQQAAYNSLFSLGSSSSGSLSSQSQPQLQSQAQTQHQSRTDTPPVPVSTYANLPSSSLLATSLYPLLTLGIAGGAVSGELGAAAWNAYQQSQLAQAQAQAGNSHMSLPQNLHQHHSQPSFLSQSQPMSTLSSERLDSPSGLQNPLESLRTSSPRYSAGSSPASFAAPAPGSSSPRFDPGSFDTRFEPSGSRFDAPARFDSQLDSQHLQFGQNTSSGSASANDSPHFATPAPARATPTGYGSSAASTPPGSGQNGRRGSSSNASQRDGL